MSFGLEQQSQGSAAPNIFCIMFSCESSLYSYDCFGTFIILLWGMNRFYCLKTWKLVFYIIQTFSAPVKILLFAEFS